MAVPATGRLREKSVPTRDFLADCVHALTEGRTSRELTTFLTAGAAARNRPDELAATVPAPARRLAERHTEQARWWNRYFTADGARVGPRRAAAYYVVFHWNRARLAFGRQVLLAESPAAGDD
ncbi:hypothetical protein GCM10017786_58030 [Amycolatopsis deserti]|uniref:Uncharacterized protein n=1 Tax=Amycolatopsis deserti TaxID=185696 RepID=A0ABQ3JG92_9PSEU|nr:hypothetical protein [Amycolatopsis deserti]GHF16531.1 hypothetical protein GCM10017786_58030 [Amycolatopsis deserti]